MPTDSMIWYGSPWSEDPKRWERCKAEARRQKLAGGFDPMSAKLHDAVRKRARVLFNQRLVK